MYTPKLMDNGSSIVEHSQAIGTGAELFKITKHLISKVFKLATNLSENQKVMYLIVLPIAGLYVINRILHSIYTTVNNMQNMCRRRNVGKLLEDVKLL